MDLNDAGRIIAVVDKRIERKTSSEATTETTWGEVCGISADGKYVSAYLYGETEIPSEDFRLPSDLAVSVGDKVKVAWNGRGERWVYDVSVASDYKKVSINPGTGEILTGDGTVAPTSLTDQFASASHAATHEVGGSDPIESLGLTALTMAAQDPTDEGGEITLAGAGSYADWKADVYHNRLRMHTGGSEKMGVDDAGVVTAGLAVDVGSNARRIISNGNALGFLNGSAALPLKAKGILLSDSYSHPDPPVAGVQFGADAALFRQGAGYLRMTTGRTNAYLELQSTVDPAFLLSMPGDSGFRGVFFVNGSGQAGLEFGSGAGSRDVALSRTAANVLTLATGDRLDADAVGRRLRRTTTLSISNGSWNRVTGYTNTDWTGLSTTYNAYGGGEIRVDVAGVYVIVGRAAFAGAAGSRRIIACSFSNAAIPGAPASADETTVPTASQTYDIHLLCVYLVELSVNDTVALYVNQNSGASLNIVDAALSIARIGT